MHVTEMISGRVIVLMSKEEAKNLKRAIEEEYYDKKGYLINYHSYPSDELNHLLNKLEKVLADESD